jgi:myosin heavy subunit
MAKLNATTPHFIKCLKPNMHKRARVFHAQEILTQLQYTGIVGLCKIRQIGFPERLPLLDFLQRCATLTIGS